MSSSAMPKSIRERAAAGGGLIPIRVSRGLVEGGWVNGPIGWQLWTALDARKELRAIEATCYGRADRSHAWPNGIRTAHQRLAAQIRARGDQVTRDELEPE